MLLSDLVNERMNYTVFVEQPLALPWSANITDAQSLQFISGLLITKLDGVALLMADPSLCKSTIRQNPHI